MTLNLVYHFDEGSLKDRETASRHDAIRSLLEAVKQRPDIGKVMATPHSIAFPDDAVKGEFLERLRDFSMRHHVRLGKIFGSNRSGFCYLPPQFLLVTQEEVLYEVFPCDVDDDRVEPERFLERLVRGEAWTRLGKSHRIGRGKHQALMDQIRERPEIVETGVQLCGIDVHVSGGFAEVGYIDVVLRDREGRYLLLEVKVKPEEIDKAIGQVARHRELFASANFMAREKIRVGVACPVIPAHSLATCKTLGIECFELAQLLRSDSEGS